MRIMPDGPVDVLFAAYGGGHVAMLRPVAEVISRRGFSFGFLALTTAQAELERRGLDYFGFAELLGADDPQVQAWGRELAGPEKADSIVPHFESVAYHGLNYRDLVTSHGEEGARQLYTSHGRQGFSPVATMEALLTRLRPRVVVGTNSPRSERALFLAARNLGIPAICVVDMFAVHAISWIAEPGYAEIICVLNEEVAGFFADRGCDPARIIVTGNPAFDTISSRETITAGQDLRRARGFSDRDKVILFASNPEPERHPFTGVVGDPALPRRVETELRRLVALEPDWQLVVRYHPSETAAFIPAPKVFQSTREENLHALIHAVNLIVVLSSTVGLEAHIAGRPVVSIDMSIFTEDAPFSRMGISDGVTSLDDLQMLLKNKLAQVGLQAGCSGALTATDAVVGQIAAILGDRGMRHEAC